MRALTKTTLAACLLAGLAAMTAASRGDEVPREYRETVKKGLEWLAKQQNRDGSWTGSRGGFQVPMTAMCGMALLAEGSTMREGKYRDNIRRAVDWLMGRAQPSGLIAVAGLDRTHNGRYMYGHGFATLFLSSVVGEEDSSPRRARLVGILERAVKFTRDAQTSRGGWGYVTPKDSVAAGYPKDFDEGSVTVTQMQALRAARNAGIAVPKEAIDEGMKYLQKSTTAHGGVLYSLAMGGTEGKVALTAAAVSCGFSAGDYSSELARKWISFCRDHLRAPGEGRMGHDEYTHYYWAQCVYVMGDDRYGKMFPKVKKDEWVTWTKYRKALFDELKRTQSPDGSWPAATWTSEEVGRIYVTACYLAVMQLDKGNLPIYQR
jgi:squalene cyclase